MKAGTASTLLKIVAYSSPFVLLVCLAAGDPEPTGFIGSIPGFRSSGAYDAVQTVAPGAAFLFLLALAIAFGLAAGSNAHALSVGNERIARIGT